MNNWRGRNCHKIPFKSRFRSRSASRQIRTDAHSLLSDEIDSILIQLISGCDDLGICLIRSLRRNQVNKFLCHIHVGLLKGASHEEPAATAEDAAEEGCVTFTDDTTWNADDDDKSRSLLVPRRVA